MTGTHLQRLRPQRLRRRGAVRRLQRLRHLLHPSSASSFLRARRPGDNLLAGPASVGRSITISQSLASYGCLSHPSPCADQGPEDSPPPPNTPRLGPDDVDDEGARSDDTLLLLLGCLAASPHGRCGDHTTPAPQRPLAAAFPSRLLHAAKRGRPPVYVRWPRSLWFGVGEMGVGIETSVVEAPTPCFCGSSRKEERER